MSRKTPLYPDLRASIEVVLGVVGYRLPRVTTVTIVAMNAFQRHASGVSRRLDGKIEVGPADLSRLVQQTTLARDGIGPEHFREGPEPLRHVLRERGVGLYGRSAGYRLLRAVRDFDGARGELHLRLGLPRAAGFVWDPEVAKQGLHTLRPHDPVRFDCQGPAGCRLLLLDHAPDAGGPALLVPVLAGEWADTDLSGRSYFPSREDDPLYVPLGTAVRRVVALWPPEAVATAIDAAVPASEDAFRPIPETPLARIVACLQGTRKAEKAQAVADLFYRSAEAGKRTKTECSVPKTI